MDESLEVEVGQDINEGPAIEENKVVEMKIRNTQVAREIINKYGQEMPHLEEFFRDGTQVLFLGEEHVDYTNPLFILERVEQLKEAGVTSMGFEILADERNKAIFERINNGDIKAVEEIDWSLGWGNPLVRQLKTRLVKKLAEAGIKIYPFSHWGKNSTYLKESEEMAALDIQSAVRSSGRTVVLVGRQHVIYTQRRPRIYKFPHTADCVSNLGIKTKRLVFEGGMRKPFLYSRSPRYYMQEAASSLNKPMFIGLQSLRVEDYEVDGIVVLPPRPFLAANEPSPTEIPKILT